MINAGTKQQERSALKLNATEEEAINSIQLLQEIEPLLKEYFIGSFKISGNAISMNFDNGQKFRLVVGEVVNG